MAAYFQLLDKVTGEAVEFNRIDEEICEHFKVPVDAVQYYCGWYNAIGFPTSVGQTFARIKAHFQECVDECENKQWYSRLIEILEFIESKYTADSWFGM